LISSHKLPFGFVDKNHRYGFAEARNDFHFDRISVNAVHGGGPEFGERANLS
jgi:hypothetical protein